ncbi:hypothetical protein R1flu_017674 [Riccia fluitans]|uniref:Uncharacterized protein n=1 Tax=Riccia fluitans TaxID=41844 RepID=A0ABD1ZDN0_9MARC
MTKEDFLHFSSSHLNHRDRLYLLNSRLQTEQKLTLRDLVFLLHIPRTGRRTNYQCQPGCRLISTHGDYSIMEKLPHGKASVVTYLLYLVSRVFSNYEFLQAVARFLRHYKQQTNLCRPGPTKINTRLRRTLDIWPWKYLHEASEAGQLIVNLEGSRFQSQEAAGGPQKTDRRLLDDQHMTSVQVRMIAGERIRWRPSKLPMPKSTSETMIENTIDEVWNLPGG